MILLLALALAVGWALARGGQLRQLQSFSLRAPLIVGAAFLIQAGLIYVPAVESIGNSGRVALLVFSYLLAGWFVWLNRRLPGMWLMGAGLWLNALVMLANGGYMPITYEALAAAGRLRLASSAETGTVVMSSKDILLPFAETRLALLSDVFVIPPPFPFSGVFSVGDVLIALGLFRLTPFAFGVGRGALHTGSAGL